MLVALQSQAAKIYYLLNDKNEIMKVQEGELVCLYDFQANNAAPRLMDAFKNKEVYDYDTLSSGEGLLSY